MSEPLILAHQRDGVLTITLNRPAKLNALVEDMRERLLDALDRAAAAEVGAVVITGAGRGFCAGGDVSVMAELHATGDTTALRRVLELGAELVTRIRALPKPVLACVNGVAAGAGCNLALACDLRLAGEGASFVQSFHRIGLGPDWGGSFFLPRLIGPARALEMIWSAEPVDAPRALSWGLVNAVVPGEQLGAECAAWSARLAALPRPAAAAAKANVYRSEAESLAAALAAEVEAQMACFASPDFAQRLHAFLDGRRLPVERAGG